MLFDQVEVKWQGQCGELSKRKLQPFAWQVGLPWRTEKNAINMPVCLAGFECAVHSRKCHKCDVKMNYGESDKEIAEESVPLV